MKDNHETKNANNKVDILYNFWLGRKFRNITFIPLSDEEVKDIQELLENQV
jgi:hypothetical protein